MTIALTEKLSFGERHGFFRRRSLASPAIRQTFETVPPQDVSPDVLDRIEAIVANPTTTETGRIEYDTDLKELIGLCRAEVADDDTQEIPSVLTEAVHTTAEQMIETWSNDDYTMAAVSALTEAFAITEDRRLIAAAVEIVDNNPRLTGILPQLEKSIHFAAEHADELEPGFKVIQPITNQPSIPMYLGQNAPAASPEIDRLDASIPISEFESIFDPKIRRPNTPEYTHAGVHPDLKKIA